MTIHEDYRDLRGRIKEDIEAAVYGALAINEATRSNEDAKEGVTYLKLILAELQGRRTVNLEASAIRTLIFIAVAAIAVKLWFFSA